MLLVLILHPPQDCIRGNKREAEFIGDAREITRVESYNDLRPSVCCGLKHHVVVGIPQLWAPQEMGLDRFGDGCKHVENDLRLGNRYSCFCEMLRSRQNGFVFQKQGDRRNHRKLASADSRTISAAAPVRLRIAVTRTLY